MTPYELKNFAGRFRSYVRYSGLSKKKLAFFFKCGTNTLYKWEHGEKEPTPQQMELIKKHMGIKTDAVLYAPFPRGYEPATIEGCSIEEWRARALVAEQRLMQAETQIEELKSILKP